MTIQKPSYHNKSNKWIEKTYQIRNAIEFEQEEWAYVFGQAEKQNNHNSPTCG